MPVPKAKDTGAKYRNTIVSSGPYKFERSATGQELQPGAERPVGPATDENRKALPDKYEVSLNVNADDIDNRLISGDLDVDVAGTGAQPASLPRILQDPALKANADNPTRPGSGTPRSTRR